VLDVFAVMAHEIGIAGDMTRLERWGHQLALVTVKIAFTQEEAIAENGTNECMQANTFVKIVGMFDEDAMHVLWCIEQDARERPDVHAADITFCCLTPQEVQAIFTEFVQVSDQGVSTKVAKRFLG
jgi:hypothetical protein